nr:hypothetical protein [Pandoravirus aubagnensis]
MPFAQPFPALTEPFWCVLFFASVRWRGASRTFFLFSPFSLWVIAFFLCVPDKRKRLFLFLCIFLFVLRKKENGNTTDKSVRKVAQAGTRCVNREMTNNNNNNKKARQSLGPTAECRQDNVVKRRVYAVSASSTGLAMVTAPKDSAWPSDAL